MFDKELTAETNSSRSFQKQNNHLSSLGCSTMNQGSVGTRAPHVGHSTYLYPTFNLHISYFSWNYFVCVSGRSQQPEPSGPSRKVPDLPDLLLSSSPRTFGHRSVCKLTSQRYTTCPSCSECHGFIYLFVCLFNWKWGCLLFYGSLWVIIVRFPVFVVCVACFSYLLKTIPYLARSHTPLLISSFHPPLTRAFPHACAGPLYGAGGAGLSKACVR